MIDLENGDLIDSYIDNKPTKTTYEYIYYCPSSDLVSFDQQTWIPLDYFKCAASTGRYVVGDKVYHNRDEGIISKVIEPDNWGDWEARNSYEVIFADPSKAKAIIYESDLFRHPLDSHGNIIKCECGVDSVNGGIHSDWCAKSFKNIRRI